MVFVATSCVHTAHEVRFVQLWHPSKVRRRLFTCEEGEKREKGRAHGTAGGGGGAGTYSEPDTDEESEEESEWEEEGEHGAWEDGPPRAAAPERDK